MSTFQELGLNEDLLHAITDLGFETPSDVQAKAIPILLKSIMNLTKKSEFDEALKKIKALENYVKLTKEEFEDEGI